MGGCKILDGISLGDISQGMYIENATCYGLSLVGGAFDKKLTLERDRGLCFLGFIVAGG